MLIISVTCITLFLSSCSESETDLPQDNPGEEITKDSNITFDGKTYSTWIKDTYYYIGIYDPSTQKPIIEIPTEIEGGLNQIADLLYGKKQSYTIKGCYILDIKKNKDDTYLLLEYSEYKYGLGITEIIQMRENKIIRRLKNTNGWGRPNKLINWYDGYIIATADVKLSAYSYFAFQLYDSEFSLIHDAESTGNPIDFFTNIYPVGIFTAIRVGSTVVDLCDISKEIPGTSVWSYWYNDKSAIIKQKEINIEGNIASFKIELIYVDGVEEIISFKLNIENGTLIE